VEFDAVDRRKCLNFAVYMRTALFPNRFIANDNGRYEKYMKFEMKMEKVNGEGGELCGMK
jgi:hypothetical protein